MKTLGGDYIELDIDKIDLNPWNPNQMNEKEFERLIREINESGMIAPIQVVPMPKGRYRVIGGAHRLQVCKILEYENIPAVVLTEEKWQDEGLQKLETVRLNIIKGGLNPEKMMSLYNSVSERYGDEALSDLLGFSDERALAKIVGDVKRSMKDAGLPDEAISKLEDEAEKIKDSSKFLDHLGEILEKIYATYGETVDNRFIYFDWGGKKHLYLEVKGPTFKRVQKVMAYLKKNGLNADTYFRAIMDKAIEEIERENTDGN
ncbi:hypothetical protein CL629_02345 [bacterium]|nr:hypothetical protein [bacterium]|tara:strand:- start:524 stop:1306 length:783 start_codon:yes stop_codon:yes gene_type:complete